MTWGLSEAGLALLSSTVQQAAADPPQTSSPALPRLIVCHRWITFLMPLSKDAVGKKDGRDSCTALFFSGDIGIKSLINKYPGRHCLGWHLVTNRNELQDDATRAPPRGAKVSKRGQDKKVASVHIRAPPGICTKCSAAHVHSCSAGLHLWPLVNRTRV